MTEKYKITYLPLFHEDLDKITDYTLYRLKNEPATKRLIDEIEKEINKRAYNPIAYEIYSTTKERKNNYYRIYVKNYTIFYTVKDNIMEVRRILYNKRNFDRLI